MAYSHGLPAYRDIVPQVPGYRIERQLGRGSMGVVYLAEDVQLRRKVALKILAPTTADDELFRKRFDRESQSAANLDHPNIVPVYAAGEAGGSLYIAMRYVGAGDLRAMLDANGPLRLQQAADMVQAVAAALDAAHAQGMIHRDVKPANILIDDRNGQAHYYLSDFGIAKIVSAGLSLTSAGQIVGTIDYIAPEQIHGKPVDGRADLYALGCVLYQSLTGVVPFPRDDTAALMWAHVQDEAAPVTTRRPDLPQQIDSIVAKAIAKQPEDRYDTCRELALALRVLAADPADSVDRGTVLPARPIDSSPPPLPVPFGMTSTYSPPTPPPVRAAVSSSPSRRSRWWWFAAGVLILALIAGSTAGVMKYFSSRFPNAAEQALLGEVPLALTTKNTCTRNDQAERDTANVQASVICKSDADAANSIVFTKFDSTKALNTQYQATVATAGVGQSSGNCLNADRAEGVYTGESGQTSGRTMCYQQRGSSFVAWTDDRVHTLAQATRVDPDYMSSGIGGLAWWASRPALRPRLRPRPERRLRTPRSRPTKPRNKPTPTKNSKPRKLRSKPTPPRNRSTTLKNRPRLTGNNRKTKPKNKRTPTKNRSTTLKNRPKTPRSRPDNRTRPNNRTKTEGIETAEKTAGTPEIKAKTTEAPIAARTTGAPILAPRTSSNRSTMR
jgi:serine/threonine protein kinase